MDSSGEGGSAEILTHSPCTKNRAPTLALVHAQTQTQTQTQAQIRTRTQAQIRTRTRTRTQTTYTLARVGLAR